MRIKMGDDEMTPASASPMIISDTGTHIVIAVEISKAMLARHLRFIEQLLAAATPPAIEDDE